MAAEERALSIRLVREHCLTKEQQQLPPEDIADLLLEHSALDVHGACISAIHELYAFSHIQSLSLSHNCIADMSPVAALVKCKIIRLDHNRIEQIRGVEMLHKLIELDVQHNGIVFPAQGFDLPKQLRKLCLLGNPLFPRSHSDSDSDTHASQLAEMEQQIRARCSNIRIDVCEFAASEESTGAASKERTLRDSMLVFVSHSPPPPPQLPQPPFHEPPHAIDEATVPFGAEDLAKYKQEMDRVGDDELRVFREHRLQSKQTMAQAEASTATTASKDSGGNRVLKAREYLQLRREQLRKELEDYEQATRVQIEYLRQQQQERQRQLQQELQQQMERSFDFDSDEPTNDDSEDSESDTR